MVYTVINVFFIPIDKQQNRQKGGFVVTRLQFMYPTIDT